MSWRQKLASIIPRGTWAYGANLCDGIYDVETVLLKQVDVINYGRERVHHLTTCVVGPPEAGKTSLIRKLAGEEFQYQRQPTKLCETSVIERVVVSENFVDVKTWKKSKEKTDTEELIVHRVANRLDEDTVNQRGEFPLYFFRLMCLMAFCEATCLVSMAFGAQPLASVCLSVVVGYFVLGFHVTAMRMALACTTMFYIVIGHINLELAQHCEGLECSLDVLNRIMMSALLHSALWGTATGFGFNPGIATGLALSVMDSTKDEKLAAMDKVYPGSAALFHLDDFDAYVMTYWLIVLAAIVVGFAIGNWLKRKEYFPALIFAPILTIMWGLNRFQYPGCFIIDKIPISYAFPWMVMVSFMVAIAFLRVGRYIGSDNQKPVNLRAMDCVKVFMFINIPGVIMGFSAVVFLHGATNMPVTLNNLFFALSTVVSMCVLTKARTLYDFLQYERRDVHATVLKATKKNSKVNHNVPLHDCFKLLIRDFAGHMVYHCMHQPFLPRCAIFVCVFNWKKSHDISLKYALGEKTYEADGPDKCLEEILFWLKNISMHRIHPNYSAVGERQLNDNMDAQDIKNVVLVGTHKSSCGLQDQEKKLILNYYKKTIKDHSGIYNSLSLAVDDIGAISVENRDDIVDAGIDQLKHYLVECSHNVINCCFQDPMPVYYWCWLKEKRDKCSTQNKPPYELFSQSHLDDMEYREVYQPLIFKKMLDQFSCIGEVFLVPIEGIKDEDFYIFFDVQFLIDFMKDMVNIDDHKTSHRMNSAHWTMLKENGHAKISLLEDHLNQFLLARDLTPKYEINGKELILHPLVQSMMHLDFLFILEDDFYMPQFLLKHRNDDPHEHFFRQVSDVSWEYVFDFGDFEFHHEFVFFRLLSRCAKSIVCSLCAIHSNWASFVVIKNDNWACDQNEEPEKQWFTLTCDKAKCKAGLENVNNRITVRASSNMDKESFLGILDCVKENVRAIVRDGFSQLKVSEFFNCPNRCELEYTHKIDTLIDNGSCAIFCKAGTCEDNALVAKVRADPSRLPYVADDILDWLSASIDDDRHFNSLMSYLLNTHETNIELKMTDKSKPKREIKTRIVSDWSNGYEATLDTLLEGFHKLQLHNLKVQFDELFLVPQ